MTWPATSRHLRGYGAEWSRIRARVLERDMYLCQCRHCKAEGRTAIATQVDHVVSRAHAKAMGWSVERTESEANLQAINAACHKRKTIEEEGGTYQSPRLIGIDGFPIV